MARSEDELAVEASPAEAARVRCHRRWLLGLTALGVLVPLGAALWLLLVA